jgi:hypothetical protein
MDPFLQEPFNFMTCPTNTVLDENDQKAFSSFLDAFFLDPDMQPNNNEFYYPPSVNQEEEEYRRNSILQSLDEQKKLQRLNLVASTKTTDLVRNKKKKPSPSEQETPQTIYLRASESLTSPYHYQPTTITTTTATKKRSCSVLYQNEKLPPIERSSSVSSSSTINTHQSKKSRVHRELLTEEEKRANHIASEQKRRSTIRNGFKELTDLIPTLKNINNSKSTVLFKAVEFIRYLEKRNKHLRDKVGSLEVRVEVEGRMTQQLTNSNVLNKEKQLQEPTEKKAHVETAPACSTMSYEKPMKKTSTAKPSPSLLSYSLQNTSKSYQPQPAEKRDSTSGGGTISPNSHHQMKGLPANARNALLAHKTQQKQLLLLQEQLQIHQRLIAQQQEMKERSLKIANGAKLPPILTHPYDANPSSLLQELEDKAISAP